MCNVTYVTWRKEVVGEEEDIYQREMYYIVPGLSSLSKVVGKSYTFGKLPGRKKEYRKYFHPLQERPRETSYKSYRVRDFSRHIDCNFDIHPTRFLNLHFISFDDQHI